MRRNLLAIFVGVLLSFALTFAGVRLAWFLIVGNVDASEDKDAIVRVFLWEMFLIVPALCVVTGCIVALIARRSGWWLGGLAVLPLFTYGFIRGAHSFEIVLFVADSGLAFLAAFVVSRFKPSLSP